MDSNYEAKICFVAVFFSIEKYVIIGYAVNVHGIPTMAGDPKALSVNSDSEQIGKSVRDIFGASWKYTLADIDPNKKVWTKATGIKGWTAFAKKHELIHIEWINSALSIKIRHNQKELTHYSFEYKSPLDEIILPNTASDAELGEAVKNLTQQVRELYPERFGLPSKVELPERPSVSFETLDEVSREVSYVTLPDDFEGAGDNDCYESFELPGTESYLIFGYAVGYESLTEDEIKKRWQRIYGPAKTFKLERTVVGVFDRIAEWENDKYHVISHFNSDFDADGGKCVLECQMLCDLSKSTSKQRKLLRSEYEKLLKSVQVKDES